MPILRAATPLLSAASMSRGLLLAIVGISWASDALAQIYIPQDDDYTVARGATLEGNVLENDMIVDLIPGLRVEALDVVPGLAISPSGEFTFASDNAGPVSFRYVIATDGLGVSSQATVRITVTGTVDDSYATAEDTQLTVSAAEGVLANDVPPNGSTAVLVNDVDNGTLALNANGSFLYTPNANFSGTDSFTYRWATGGAPATVTITVDSVDDPPMAANDSYQTPNATPLTVNAANGVLANDTDVDTPRASLTAVLVTNPSSGTLTLNPDGSFTYSPTGAFSGNDTFTYRASDGNSTSDIATVTIAVAAPNQAPTATNDSYTVAEGATLSVNAANGVLSNDSDPEGANLTAVLVNGVTNGTLTLNANGSFTYQPPAGFAGTVTFTYQADDGPNRSNVATVTITVTEVDDPPVAVPDSYTTAEDTPLIVNAANGVLANDEDPDTPRSELTAVLVRNVNNGSLTLSSNGAFTFTPAPNFNGTATFTYQARDASSSSPAATVTITVTPVNDPPFFTNSPPTTVDEGVTYNYTLGVADPDGDTLTIAAPTLPSWLTFRPPATISGTPTQEHVGAHTVTMTASDGIAPPIVRTFQITVQEVDNAPTIATIPAQTATEASPYSLDLTQFVTDSDTPAASLVFRATGGLPPGLTLATNGVISGTPTANTSVGNYTVRFTVSDAVSTVPGQLRLTVLRAGRADLAVALGASPNPVAINATTTWTITVTNQAPLVAVPSAVIEAVFTGDVPFRFDPPTNPACTVTPSGNESRVSCTVGPLAGGASAAIQLTGSSTLAGDVFGTATVAINGTVPIDETPDNDQASASLNIAQRVSAAPVQEIPDIAARAAAAGDLDGDGYDDLAVVTASSAGTVLLMNTPDPANPNKRVMSPTPNAIGGEALGTDIAVADVDRDGDLDVITAASAGAPNRLFISAGGTYTSVALGNPNTDSRAVVVGDVNGDAFVDVLFANSGASTLYVNTGSPSTPYSSGTPIGNHDARDAVLVDLFGDALPELVIAVGNGDAVVYRNNGGTFAFERTLPTGPTVSVTAADFNGDGRADLVFGRNAAVPPATRPTNLVFLNTSTAALDFFLASQLGGAATSHVLAGDFDLDGDIDVLAVNGDGQQLYANAGNGTFALHPQALGSQSARMAVSGKFGADPRVDLAVVANGGIAIYYNDGAGNFGAGDTVGPTIQLLGQPTVSVIVGETYTDAGATATDALDGDVTSRITVQNPVNTSVIGEYVVRYDATDLSGNSATPVTRTVRVQAREESGGGGGGALRLELLLLTGLALIVIAGRMPRAKRSRRGA